MRSPLALALLCGLVAAPALAQPVTTPAPGSPVRQAILDALRLDAAQTHGLPASVVFYGVTLRVSGRWAYADAEPRTRDGRPLGHCGGKTDMVGDPALIALLYRDGGRWQVVESGTCASDVWFLHWHALYGAPTALGIPDAPSLPSQGEVAQTDDGFLALRTQPSIRRGSRLTRMPSGASVRVLGCEAGLQQIEGDWGRWCRVRYGSRTGWAFSAYLVVY